MGNLSSVPEKTIRDLKIGFIFFIWAWAFFAGILPLKVASCRNSEKFLSLASAFSGGVFLAMALIHILPEAAADYTALRIEEDGPDATIFPLPFLLVFCGYTLVLIIDKVMFDSHALLEGEGGHGHGHGHGHGKPEKEERGHSHGHSHHESDNDINKTQITQDAVSMDKGALPDKDHQKHGHGHEKKEKHHHHEKADVKHFDPATNKLISNTKKSMMEIHNLNTAKMSKADIMRSMAKENQEITDNIKQYLSKADKFSVRMSAALHRSGIFKSKLASSHQDQENNMFVD